MTTRSALALALVLAATSSAAVNAEPVNTSPRRVAVVVGANAAAPSRKALRFAHADARSMAAVLRDVGGFEDGEVIVLRDPNPSALLATLDRALADAARVKRDTLLGLLLLRPRRQHLAVPERAQALAPGAPRPTGGLAGGGPDRRDRRLSRRRLDRRQGAHRIRAVRRRSRGRARQRGLGADRVELRNGGRARVVAVARVVFHPPTSRSRSAAPGTKIATGRITLIEAFEYAKTRTVRDTALHTETPQSPSFQYNLRGRSDLPLTTVRASSTRLTLSQRTGPLQLIHIDTGLVVLEVPRGRKSVTLALPPGRYVVRRQRAGRLYAREVAVSAGRTTRIDEAQLTLVGSGRLAVKGAGAIERARGRGDELMVGFQFSSPRFLFTDPAGVTGPSTFTGGLDAYLAVASYLRRHTGNWGTRLSIGAGRQDSGVSGEAAIHAAIGPVLSAQLDRRGNLEVYGAAELAGQLSVFVDPSGAPPQLTASASGGLRLFSVYAEVGGIINLAPRSGTHSGLVFEERRPGVRAEVGLRFENTLFE